jgi:hypothetical protein
LFAGFYFFKTSQSAIFDAAGFIDKVLSRHISGLSFADAPHEFLTKTPLYKSSNRVYTLGSCWLSFGE